MSSPPPSSPYRVQFVCTGNICRSPMAEVVARAILADSGRDRDVSAATSADTSPETSRESSREIQVDSSGTDGWHIGDGADPRTVRVLRDHGYDGAAHRARQFDRAAYDDLDLIVALDRGHEQLLRRWAPSDAARDKVVLLRSFDEHAVSRGELEVDDPWYGGAAEFERCLAEVERAVRGLVAHLRAGELSESTGPGPQPADSV